MRPTLRLAFVLLLAHTATLSARGLAEDDGVGPPYDSQGRGCCTGGQHDPSKCWNVDGSTAPLVAQDGAGPIFCPGQTRRR
ncbi:hypothetical protein FA10DRAFT_268983 [Acaromyces ingoldii]|uniref:CBM1 domain-containing protein n=1 Tax=Acaromyces ingoldii TaxID=215250 RepID=A0A316YHR9_9BASI|nr:hypothetical protein FA10DRAFT_268983 [Acaromyces ingoldii]PWN87653.1 hypothetical protein FA10DRAFT_268983 [Acaromyces ingoldii]